MKRPNEAEIAAAKSECIKRFGHDRMIGIPLRPPVDAYLVLAAMDLAAASRYQDANLRSGPNAAAEVMETRVLWPDEEAVSALRDRWGMLDAVIAGTGGELLRALGYLGGGGMLVVEPLTIGSAPAGFAPSARDVPKAIEALQQASPGAALWSVECRDNGLTLVLRAPPSAAMVAISRASHAAIVSGQGTLTALVGYARDLCAWAPGIVGGNIVAAFDRHLDEKPWRANEIGEALLKIGGAGTAERAEFL